MLDEQGNRKAEYLRGDRLYGEMPEQKLILQIFDKKNKEISDTVTIHKTEKELPVDILVPNKEKRLLLKWITLKQDHINLGRYFEMHSLYTIAVYGLGERGIRFLDELRDSNVKIQYVVDKNAKQFAVSFPLYTPNEELEEVDAMVVTVLNGFRDIEERMAYKLQCPIISIEDVIESLA